MPLDKHFHLVMSLTKEMRKSIAGAILFNEQVAAAVGLNGTDLQFINLLELEEAVTPRDLARWSGLTTGGVTVVLDRLEKAGYIKRMPNPADRRSVIIRPVASQLRKLQQFYRSKGESVANAASSYSDHELELILGFLNRINTREAD